MMVGMIVAMDDRGGIGRGGELPWGRALRQDLKRFKRTTMNHAVLVGRKTFEGMPRLKGRDVIVVSSRSAEDLALGEREYVAPTLDAALDQARALYHTQAWVAGGAQLYEEALTRRLVDEAHVTRVSGDFDADTHMPRITSHAGFRTPWHNTLTYRGVREVDEAGHTVRVQYLSRSPYGAMRGVGAVTHTVSISMDLDVRWVLGQVYPDLDSSTDPTPGEIEALIERYGGPERILSEWGLGSELGMSVRVHRHEVSQRKG